MNELYQPVSLFPSVHYRMFAVTPRMEPVERDDEIQTDASIVIEIVVFHLNLLRTQIKKIIILQSA